MSVDLRWVAGFRARLHEYLFKPALPFNLGFLRLVFFAYMLWLFSDLDTSLWADVPRTFWREWSRYDLLGLPPASPGVLHALDLVFKAALLVSCLGFYTRWATSLSFVLGLYLLGLPQNYSKISHYPGLLLLVMLVMALSRCGDALSLDAAAARRRGERWRADGEYCWPVRLVWLLMAMAFFGAGYSKLTGTGWIGADNLRDQFILHHYLGDRDPMRLGLYIAQSGTLCAALALSTVFVELFAPLALFSRWSRWTLIPALFLLQLGNATLLSVHREFPWAVLYLFWIPWDHVVPLWNGRDSAAGRKKSEYRNPKSKTNPNSPNHNDQNEHCLTGAENAPSVSAVGPDAPPPPIH